NDRRRHSSILPLRRFFYGWTIAASKVARKAFGYARQPRHAHSRCIAPLLPQPKNRRECHPTGGSEGIDISAVALSGSGTHIPAISAVKDWLTIRRPAREGCRKAAADPLEQKQGIMNPVKELEKHGQAVWLDFLARGFVAKGDLQKLIDTDGVKGVTSNPSIFEKA